MSFERANWRQYYLTDEVLGEDAETERMSNEIYNFDGIGKFLSDRRYYRWPKSHCSVQFGHIEVVLYQGLSGV